MDLNRGSLGLIEVLLWHLPGGTEEDHKKPEYSGVLAKIQTSHLPKYKHRFVTCRPSSPVTVYQTTQRHISENSDLHSWLFLHKCLGHILCDCEAVVYLRFHHLGQFFMEPRDYYDAPHKYSPTFHMKCRVRITKVLIKRGSTIDHWRSQCKGWIIMAHSSYIHSFIHSFIHKCLGDHKVRCKHDVCRIWLRWSAVSKHL
jgi:hypothetical protein